MHTMDSLLAPAPILTTIFMKPIWFVQFVTAIIPFLIYNRESIITPKVFTFHQAVRNDPETKGLKIGSAGFCWGGTYTVLLCAADALVDAGFTAHPSPMKFPDAWDSVQKPLSLSIGDVDMALKVDAVRKIKELMEEKKEAGQHEVVIIPGAKHGFAIRANPKDEDQVKSAGEAATQALSWFGKWLV
jgi:dienelactone hydrolase